MQRGRNTIVSLPHTDGQAARDLQHGPEPETEPNECDQLFAKRDKPNAKKKKK